MTQHATEHEAYQQHSVHRKQSEPQFPALFEVVDREAIVERKATYHLVEVKSEEISVISSVPEEGSMKKLVDEYYGILRI